MSIKAGEVWFNHRKAYLKENALRGISLREFMELHKLNYNSGRRWFAKIQKLENELSSDKLVLASLLNAKRGRPTTKSDHIKDDQVKEPSKGRPVKALTKKKVVKKAQKKSDRIKSDQNNSDQSKPNPNADSVKSIKNKSLTPRSKGGERAPQYQSEKVITKKQRRLTIPLQVKHRDNSSDQQIGKGGKFQRGNAAAVYHGGYMDLIHADADIKAVVEQSTSNLNDIIKIENVRYLQMQRMLGKRITHIRHLEEIGQLPKDAENQEISAEDLERDAYWGASGQLTNVFSAIAMASTQSMKADIDTEAKYFKLESEREQRESLLRIMGEWDSTDEEITALSVAQEIERHGCKSPVMLQALAQKEIDLLAPKMDDSGITDAELDQMVEDYKVELVNDIEKVARNKIDIEQMMMEAEARRVSGDLSEEDFASDAYTGLEHFDDGGDQVETELSDSDEWSD